MQKGFDYDLYLKVQKEKIDERINMFDKLYIEFGGKIFDDYHASRVLPGFCPNAKIQLLENFKEDMEIIFCINAKDIEKSKIRADYGISYEMELIRLIDNIKSLGISINSVVITMYQGEKCVHRLEQTLANKNIKTYVHIPTDGYPNDIELIVSENGYGKNLYIETTKKMIVVTAPGPNSGKLGTCLSQLYHEYKRGIKAGYAKFETFPVWNLNLMHPVNIAYEAATADLNDINMIDSFHLEAYGENAVNYNRDISTFPILKNILTKISGKSIYNSPTDMGVNMIKSCIVDDDIVQKAAKMEVIRRYYFALCEYKQEICSKEVVDRLETLMNKLNLSVNDRSVVKIALDKSAKENREVIAIQLKNGKIITGKESELLSATSTMLLNTLKELAGIPDEVYLLPADMLEAILNMKKKTIYKTSYSLNVQEVLIALSICSKNDERIKNAFEKINELQGCEAHATYIVEQSELNIIKGLGINLTCEPKM